MKRIAIFIACLVISTGTYGQNAKSKRAAASSQPQARIPVAVERPTQPAWYEKGISRINAKDTNFGSWLEERRRAFVESKIANPYFEYSLWLTVALFAVGAIAIKLRMDKARVIQVTADAMVDLRSQELLSHQAAEEAIRRHNEHIESCNRVFVMETSGDQPMGFVSSTLESELKRVGDELQRANAEIARLTQENEAKAKTLASLSLRLEGIAGEQAKNASVDLSTADGRLIHHINTLQEKLHAQEKDNRKLRGA